ncbi:39S ribosomal protein L35, mitochondrial [Spodoptera litura]|uniref:Large ribosomal subunit protein bL35m n=1 Tax=Spodoptera litura TaxID=69820 RepID=A0A9J7IU89_SPOLT|nr:39S ribosomal protein L35, mitochondrial [Spodoptera litura]
MFRLAISAVRSIRPLSISYLNAANIISSSSRNYGTFQNLLRTPIHTCIKQNSLVNNTQILDISSKLSVVPVRTVTKFSLQKGKRKTVKAAVRRFFRLHWGGWIRSKVGRHKKMWKKSSSQKRRLRQHVFCNSTQSTMLDKMVTKFWKKPKYYVDDPYAPYHTREEFTTTRTKPFVKQ